MFAPQNKKFMKYISTSILLLLVLSQFYENRVLGASEPGPPRNLTKKDISVQKITLTWDPPVNDGGSPILGYVVEYTLPTKVINGDGVWRTLDDSVTKLEYNYTSGALPYAYRVSAKNSVGIGLPSNYVGSLSGSPEAPNQVYETNATRVSSAEMNVTWKKPSQDGGMPILGYRIEYWPYNKLAEKQTINTSDPEKLVHKISGLNSSMKYTFRVAAYNRVGVGGFSQASTVDIFHMNLARFKFIVYDGGTRIKDATVSVGSKTYTTDYNGFAFTDYLPLGTHSYTVSKRGYKDKLGQGKLQTENDLLPILVEMSSDVGVLKVTGELYEQSGVRRVKGDLHIDVKGVLTKLYTALLRVEVKDPDGVLYGSKEFRSNNMEEYNRLGVAFDEEIPDIGLKPKLGEWAVTVSVLDEVSKVVTATMTQKFTVSARAQTELMIYADIFYDGFDLDGLRITGSINPPIQNAEITIKILKGKIYKIINLYGDEEIIGFVDEITTYTDSNGLYKLITVPDNGQDIELQAEWAGNDEYDGAKSIILKIGYYQSLHCIIATATYGSALSPEVKFMRHVRDDLIGSNNVGKVLVNGWNRFYYSWSPPIAYAITGSQLLRSAFTVLLTPLMGIIHVVAFEYSLMESVSPELASVTGFITAAIMSILVYIVAPVWLIRVITRRINN